MNLCLKCKHADWQRTATNRMHPSGDGACTFPYKLPELPASMYWLGEHPPKPFGGYINRHHRKDVTACPTYEEKKR